MSSLHKNVANCIWHAFDALQSSALVHKSKLKVLTANIGTLIDLYGVEKGLDHYKSALELNFEEYKYYLQYEVFSSLPSTLSLTVLRDYETKISEVCWLVCRKLLLSDKSIFDEESLFKLFRIFCLLGDLHEDPDNNVNYEVILQPSEAGAVAEQLVHSLGARWDAGDWEALGSSIGYFKWATFVAVLEARYCGDGQPERAAVAEAVEELHDIFIKDIIKKGYLMKRGYLLPTMREYWFVLQPCELTYYKSSAEKEQCGKIALNKHCSVEAAGQESGRIQRLALVTPERTFDFATQDHKSRLQWVSALQLAVSVCDGAEGYQRGARARRRGAGARREQEAREAREARARLQQEIRARLAAEAQAQELAVMAEADNKKLVELKKAQTTLERLLLEETQAKKDEEIVRSLQARVLAEEWEKRAELERLQEEQHRLLDEERLKRKRFEQLQGEKETQYREASERLKQLEAERQRLDEELQMAQRTIRHSEETAHSLQVKLRELSPPLKNADRIRRAFSFIPKSSSDTLIDVRAASVRKNYLDEEKQSDKL